MKDLNRELETLIKDMNSVDKLTDDLFIQYFEKEEAMQEKLEALKKANKLSAEEYETLSGRLVEAFGRLKGKLSFCNLA
jgi:peptidoglycan hydrolase CwlO-like protein